MKIVRRPTAMTQWSERLRLEGVTIGLVPTMGALHEGHRSLIRAARLSCDALVVSIFVNPAQFGPGEDLARYPRPIADDRRLCRREGVDVCFEPPADAMYPPCFQTTVTVSGLAGRWEGAARPHHFTGVATVVTKLFGIVRPHVALFGQKDYQQSVLVRRLMEDLNLNVDVRVKPTVREPDGLALSSRNVYLTAAQRKAAPVLYRALRAGASAIKAGIRSGKKIERVMRYVVAQEPLAHPEYLAACHPNSLEPLSEFDGTVVLLGAVRIGAVRLIDNVVVTVPRRPR